MSGGARSTPRLDPLKFRDPERTASGEARARVALAGLQTLWFNTGTLCNLECGHCYIESSPLNDRLVYLRAAEVADYLDEIAALGLPTRGIGFTGGEPFMNPEILQMLGLALERGFRVLVLSNAMRPLQRSAEELGRLRERCGERLAIRVSLDHYTREVHERERGARSWAPTLRGLRWLASQGFALSVAGRGGWGESEPELRRGYARLFEALGLALDAGDPDALVLFPEMDGALDVPEITERCWKILGVAPDSLMCARSRMVVKRKGDERPLVMPCTLLPYGDAFVMGRTLAEASREVRLNHPHCARFCVLGGGSCSGGR